MQAENPYAASHSRFEDVPQRPSPGMTVAKALTVIVGSGVGFAALGAALGAILALLAPGYYRGVFSGGQAADFDPLQVGLGLGLTQGTICGLIIGAVIVLGVSLSSRRSAG